MPKKIWIILFFVTAVGARQALPLQELAFAANQDDGTPCPPECVTDSMEIVTWYPSPYNEYEELRLYPVQRDDNYCTNDKIGLMYYDDGGTPSFGDDDKMRVCKGTLLGWQEVGGGFWQQSSGSDISNTNSGKVTINTTDSNKVSLEASGAVRLGNYATGARPNCSNTILGALVYDTTEKRPYVCALNASNSPVWKPLDSDYDRDGITDAVDYNDNDLNDATAVEANVETGKTFYASGGSRRTGTLAVEEVQNFCAVEFRDLRPNSIAWRSCSKFGSKAICAGTGQFSYNPCSCAPGYTLTMWISSADAISRDYFNFHAQVYYCKKD